MEHSALTPVWMLSVVGFAAAASMTPGPNNTMLTVSGANFGFRRSVPHMLGVTAGYPLILLFAAFGVGTALKTYPPLYLALKIVGTLYMLWLAFKIATSAPKTHDLKNPETHDITKPEFQTTTAGRPFSFFQAAAYQWVNPKGWLSAAGAMVAFTMPGPQFTSQIFFIVCVFLCATLLSVASWTMVGVAAQTLLQSPRRLRVFNVTMATLLVVSVLAADVQTPHGG